MKARDEEFALRRDLALMTAYFSAQLGGADWKKVPPFNDWLRQMTQPKRKLSNAEILAFFRGHADGSKPN